MNHEREIVFGQFRLDPAGERLYEGKGILRLRPKSFAVLRYLAERPGRLISKAEILAAVWTDTAVSEAVLKVCIREIREALSDDPAQPRFIETAHRRGYRFIAATSHGEWPQEQERRAGSARGHRFQDAPAMDRSVSEAPKWRRTPQPVRGGLPSRLVGRESDLEVMRRMLESAMGGKRQLLFICGEPGIGKTTLVEAFIEETARGASVVTARGQCLDQYGAGEAYLPILEALGRMCREPIGVRLIEVLNRYAPTWRAQMPSVLDSSENDALRRKILGATPERMLREMAEALEALSADEPLILVLEDAHWIDYSTLDLISAVARRREPARLFLIITYRPVELVLTDHPLRKIKQELQLHSLSNEIALPFLTQEEVRRYLSLRFPNSSVASTLTGLIHHRTEGNPLFMVDVVDYLLARGLIIADGDGWSVTRDLETADLGVPENIRLMIDNKIGRLGRDELLVLEAASAAGLDFGADAPAAALDRDVIAIESICEALDSRHEFLCSLGTVEYPDRTIAGRFRFIHDLYRKVIYDRVSGMRRARIHLRLGERLENAYQTAAPEVASQLAMHFEQGADYVRAIRYHRLVAEGDARRYANREAIACLNHALGLVDRLPGADRIDARISIRERLGMLHRSSGEVMQAASQFKEMVDCAHEHQRTELESRGLLYLASSLTSIDRTRCLEAAERAAALGAAGGSDDQEPGLGHAGYWHSLLQGWRPEDDRSCESAVRAAEKSGDPVLLSLHFGRYPSFQLLRSDYAGACRTAERGSRLALEIGDGYDYLTSQYYRAWALFLAGRWDELLVIVTDAIEMGERNGSPVYQLLFRLILAALHLDTFGAAEAAELAEPALALSRSFGYRYGQMLALVLLGSARTRLGEYREAEICYNEVRAAIESQNCPLDWMMQMWLLNGISRLHMARGDLRAAHDEAMKLLRMAEQPGERTFMAFAACTLSRVAMSQHRWDDAEANLVHALRTIDDMETPVAAWPTLAAAAELYNQRGRGSEAGTVAARSAAIVQRLATLLPADSRFRETILCSTDVQILLARAPRHPHVNAAH